MSAIINAVIFAVTLALTVLTFYRKGTWSAGHARKAFRFFTVQSNVFCGAAALLMCLFPGQGWSWTLKYVATAAVSVTMLTVFLFLGPTQGGYAALLRGSDFFMHLTTPLLAIISFCVYERRGMGFGTALLGMLPVALGLGAGAELRQSMGVVLIGGLTTSTVLTLVVIPLIYMLSETWLEKRRARKRAEQGRGRS